MAPFTRHVAEGPCREETRKPSPPPRGRERMAGFGFPALWACGRRFLGTACPALSISTHAYRCGTAPIREETIMWRGASGLLVTRLTLNGQTYWPPLTAMS